MKLYPENYTVAATFPFTDLNGDPIVPQDVSAKLYDGDDQEIVDFGPLPFDPAEGGKEVVVASQFNVLGAGSLQEARVLRVSMQTDKGVIAKSLSYLIESEFRLAVMINSFQTLEAAEIIARDMLNLEGWLASDDERRQVALIEAYNRLTRIPMKFRLMETEEQRRLPDIYAEETIITRSGWTTVNETDFLEWPVHFRRALRMAQVAEANEQLEGDPIAKKHRAGIISETVGESSIMLRGGKIDHGVSQAALQHLSGHIYYNHRIVRA